VDVANPSIKDVADSAGVSVGTVSNVLNHPDRVSPVTLTVVNRIIEALGYVRNDAARQLRAGHSTVIGMVVPDITNPFFTGVLRGVEDAAQDSDLSLIVGDSGDSEVRQESYMDLFEKQRVRGMLVSPVGVLPSRLSKMAKRGTPVVLVDHDGTETGVSSVSVDDVAGGYMATHHLLETGARRIGFLAGLFGYKQVTDRLRGAELAVSEYPGARLEVIRAVNQSALAGREAADGIARRPKGEVPEAIFAVNDMLALGVLQAFMGASGIRVPDDVALVGYDDVEFAQAAIAPLSSVRQPANVMGRTALTLLQEQIADPTAAPRTVIFEPELVIRASSGAIR
jgi:LacI family transcriptional regulator